MTDGITVPLDDILDASTELQGVADTYGKTVSLMQVIANLDQGVFEPSFNSPKYEWEPLRDQLWRYLADTQDNMNLASVLLVKYAAAMYDEDSKTAAALDDVIDYDKADRP